MDTHELTNDLFNDLLDPRIPTLDVCRKHAVPITTLRRILESEEFQEAAEALIAAEKLRSKALASDRRERALATLDAITQQSPTTPTHTECIRRAASALIRATNEPRPPARAVSTPAADNENLPTHPSKPSPTPSENSAPDQPAPNGPTQHHHSPWLPHAIPDVEAQATTLA
jgi:hypothetical protein